MKIVPMQAIKILNNSSRQKELCDDHGKILYKKWE